MNNKLTGIHLLLADRKKQIFEYVVVFVLVIYAGNAAAFTSALENMDNPIGFLMPVLLVAILGYLKNISFNYKFILLITGFVFYFIASTITFGELHPRFFIIHIVKLTLVYIVVSSLGLKFFRLYEDIIYHLCIIGLTFWILMNFMPSTFIEFLRNFEVSKEGQAKGNVDVNIIIYTVNKFSSPDAGINLGGIRIIRNAGFAWEPGVFASLVNVAIFSNLIRTRFVLKKYKRLFVFLAALASTFSTTGYSLVILLLFFYIYNQDFINVFWLTPIFAFVALALFTLPFMSEKIFETMDPSGHSTERLIYLSAKYNTQYIPQRFQSFYIDFKDFLNYPVIGYGGHLQARWTNQLGAQIWTVSGLGKILGQFGLVGTVFFLFSLWKSSENIIAVFKIRGTIFPFLFILMYAISYNLFSIVVMCLWLLYLTNSKKSEVLRKIEIYNILLLRNKSQ